MAEIAGYEQELDNIVASTLGAPASAVETKFEMQQGRVVGTFEVEGAYGDGFKNPSWGTIFQQSLESESRALYNAYIGRAMDDMCVARAYFDGGMDCATLKRAHIDVTGCGCDR